MKRPMTAAILVLATALSAGAAPADKPFPGTPAGAIAEAYIKIVNSGSDADVLQFIAAHFGDEARKKRSDDERLQVFREIKLRMGEVRPHSVIKAEPGLLSILVETERAGWVSFAFSFESGDSGKLDSIVIEQAEPPM